jgi:hypothetical protein
MSNEEIKKPKPQIASESTAADDAQPDGELSEDDLDAVTGGVANRHVVTVDSPVCITKLSTP